MYTTVSIDSSHKVTEHYDMQEKLGMWVSDMSNPNFPIIIFPSRNKKFVRNYNYDISNSKEVCEWEFQVEILPRILKCFQVEACIPAWKHL